MSSRNARLLTFNPERVQEVLLRAEELGVPCSSGMFKHVVSAHSYTTKQKDAARLEFFRRTLGCSKNEVAIAVYKVPAILILSEQSLLRKIQFLINDVGLEPRYILERSMVRTQLGEAASAPALCHEDPAHKGIAGDQCELLLNS
ncbi:hypothetical protein PVAP13_8NG106501 [Panicum virgatum]|uniref:Uncharacterized protein n=1 Tax=Panicum virgatum TaxID=38727 RepID=A0A8T0P767_PANVG|nr:hypothetical protein PVAP13_8NG106501 [Panicum virgatum]